MLKRTTIRGGALVFMVAIAGGASRDSTPCEYTEYQCDDFDDWTSPPYCTGQPEADPQFYCEDWAAFVAEGLPGDFAVCCIPGEGSAWSEEFTTQCVNESYQLYCDWENRYPPN